MGLLLFALVLVLIFGGLGFALHVLWWIALVLLVLWLLGFVVGAGASAGGRRGWYGRRW